MVESRTLNVPLLLVIEVVIVGRIVVESLYPPRQACLVLQATRISWPKQDLVLHILLSLYGIKYNNIRVFVGALDLRDFYVPHPVEDERGGGESDGRLVASVGADIHVHCGKITHE